MEIGANHTGLKPKIGIVGNNASAIGTNRSIKVPFLFVGYTPATSCAFPKHEP